EHGEGCVRSRRHRRGRAPVGCGRRRRHAVSPIHPRHGDAAMSASYRANGRRAVIVGVAESDLGQVAPGTSPLDLMAMATVRALADAGLAVSDVDGIFAATSQM